MPLCTWFYEDQALNWCFLVCDFDHSDAEILILRGREIGRWKSDNEGLPLGTIRNVVMKLRIKISPKQIDLGEIDVAHRGEIQA